MNNDIIKALDGADLFLRNRANAKPAPLNEYDIEALIDIAKVCDEAANLINRKNAEIERLEANLKEAFAEIEALKHINLHCKSEAVKELSERLKDIPRKHLLLRPDSYYKQYVRVTDINNLVKEMWGECNG